MLSKSRVEQLAEIEQRLEKLEKRTCQCDIMIKSKVGSLKDYYYTRKSNGVWGIFLYFKDEIIDGFDTEEEAIVHSEKILVRYLKESGRYII